jgi:hypothetical protein
MRNLFLALAPIFPLSPPLIRYRNQVRYQLTKRKVTESDFTGTRRQLLAANVSLIFTGCRERDF